MLLLCTLTQAETEGFQAELLSRNARELEDDEVQSCFAILQLLPPLFD